MHTGDAFLADIGQARRIKVVVLTNNEFNRRAGRAVVAPCLDGPSETVPSPWRVADGDSVYAIDYLLSP